MKTGKIPKQKKLTSRVLQLEVNKFISNRNNVLLNEKNVKTGAVNQNGFVEVINGGIKSSDKESLEVIVPNEIDLSFRQNGGFSLFFWILFTKSSFNNKLVVNAFKKGNTVDQFTPSISLTNNQSNMFVALSTSKSKKESIYANKKLEINHLYSVGVSFEINYDEEITEVSLYIDGKLDTQTTIPGEPIHNQGNIYIGKSDNATHGFKGTVADIMIFPSVLNENEIDTAHNQGLEALNYSGGTDLKMNVIFSEIFKRKKLILKYAQYTNKPVYSVENLNLSNKRMLEVVKNYDAEEKKNDVEPEPEKKDVKMERMIRNIRRMMENEDALIKINKLNENAKFINTIFYYANKGEDNIEIDRVLKIFDVISGELLFNVDQNFFEPLAYNLNAVLLSKEDNTKYLKTKTFFKNLEIVLDKIEEMRIKKEEEDAKYETNLKGKKNIRNLYGSTKSRLADIKAQNQAPKDKIQSFGNSIPEHENLLLNTQNLKNAIDTEQEKNLQNYQSTFVIKSLYERPKNLPGENPSLPEVQIMSNNTSIITTDNEENKQKADLETANMILNFVDEILSEEERLINDIKLDAIKTELQAEEIEKTIIERRNKILHDKELEEQKKLAEEAAKNKKDEVVEDKKKEEHNNFDPEKIPNWADGNFEIVINHCYECHKHTTTTKHFEYTFVDKFNEIGDALKQVFPNIQILGNLDKQDYYSNFDVYLRGTGLPGDEYDRYFIYRKCDTLKFPTANEITDKCVAIAIMFGGSINLYSAQAKQIKETMRLPITHEHPANLSDIAEKIKTKRLTQPLQEKIDPERTKFFCTNHGCNKEFVQKDNERKKPCKYHPGLYQFGSYNGTWPECWTCCEGKWDDPGCKEGIHNGILMKDRLKLCLNHGEPNPNNGKPDSLCGKWYSDKSPDGCKYHSGYIEKGRWTCCSNDASAPGCVEGSHATEDYPNEKAKLYFYPKYLPNPGLKYEKKEGDQEVTTADLMRNCGYFKIIEKEYPDYKAMYREAQELLNKKDAEKDSDRYCFNWGCGKTFKESKNGRKSCLCHPGKWDHGNSGTKMVEYINEKNVTDPKELNRVTILWKPHWSCCGKDWAEKGCTRCRHHGPLKSDLNKYNMTYKYPENILKMRFRRKEVGNKWLEFLNENYVYDKDKVRTIVNKSGKSLSDLPKLCDDLRLYLLVLQEDPSYILKYWDAVNQDETVKLFLDDNKNIVTDKFIDWWFSDYETLYKKLHPKEKPKKEEKKEEEKVAEASS